MNEVLVEVFRHNAWASKAVIAACRSLTEDQLTAPGAATFGSVIETLNHVVSSDAGYIPRSPDRPRPDWVDRREPLDLDALDARVDETLERWEAFFAAPYDPAQPLLLDAGAYECQLYLPIVQALYHGDAHREQVCSMLTAFGLEAPDLQPWAWAEATGRARELDG